MIRLQNIFSPRKVTLFKVDLNKFKWRVNNFTLLKSEISLHSIGGIFMNI